MKNFILSLLFILPLLGFASNQNDPIPPEGSKESFKLSLYIPGLLVKAGSLFVSKDRNPEVKKLLRSVRSVSVVVRKGEAFRKYATSDKYEKKLNKLERKKFTSLFDVMSSEANVSIQIKQNQRSHVRQLAILIKDEDESFIFTRVRCNFNISQLQEWMKSAKEKNQLDFSSFPSSIRSLSGHP